jgi:hypothetical protein
MDFNGIHFLTKFIYLTLIYEVNFFDSLGRGINSQVFDFGKYSLDDLSLKNYINGSFRESSQGDRDVYVKGINRFFAVSDMYFMLVTNGKREKHSVFMNFDFQPIIQAEKLINDFHGMNYQNTLRFSSNIFYKLKSKYELMQVD